MSEKPEVAVYCNDCEKVTEIDIPEHIQCEHCEKRMTTKGAMTSGFGGLTVVAALVAGGFANGLADDFFTPNHYPSEMQYVIIDACVSGDHRYTFSRKELKEKRHICACAFDETRKDIDYESFGDDKKTFMKLLHRNVKECGKN